MENAHASSHDSAFIAQQPNGRSARSAYASATTKSFQRWCRLLGALALSLGVSHCSTDSPSDNGRGAENDGQVTGGANDGSVDGSASQDGSAADTSDAGGTDGALPAGDSGADSGADSGGSDASEAGTDAQSPARSALPVPPGKADAPPPSGVPGELAVLDWAGFKAALSYTFDDTNSSQIKNFDALDALGVRYTFYLTTGRSELADPVWKRALEAGHELGNHTKSHQETDDGSDTDAATKTLEQKFGSKVWTMAAPFGAGIYTNLAKTRFLINRGVFNALIAPNDDTDPFTLPCYIPPTGASTQELDAQVASARREGKWRVVLVHGFSGGTDGAYQPVSLSAFTESVQHSKDFGDVWIDSVVNIGSYWRAQKLIRSITPVTVGGETRWTWQLPDHFPPGKFLRVTVKGGTLTQNGRVLDWDGHGYYELALDEGSLTLTQ